MDNYVFNKLRELGKENNIDIFKVDDYKGERFVVHYYIDEKLNDDDSVKFDSEKFSCGFIEKTIEVDKMTLLDDVITIIKLKHTKKPPLGITPRFIWIEQRIDEIIKAMDRFREAKKEIPKEWYIELAQLENEKNNSKSILYTKLLMEL